MTRTFRRLTTPALGAVVAIVLIAAGCTGSGGGTVAPGSAGPSSAGPSSAAPSPTGAPSAAASSPAAATGCPTSQPAPLPAGQKRTVTLETSKGSIVMEIDGTLSPIAAGNIVALAECGWYDGVVFHRLVPGFVIQGGDGEFGRVGADGKLAEPQQAGTGGPGYTIKDEPVSAKYGRGVVAMARTADPDSVGSQFFIVLDDQAAEALAYYNTYQIVGKVTAGMDAVDAIAAMPNAGEQAGNAALEPVPMTKVTVTQ